MFARNRRTKRTVVGYLGIVVGAALMLLSANAGPATAAPAPKLDKLTLEALCTLPNGDAVFRVGNTNSVDVSYTWTVDKTTFSGSGVAHPGDGYFYVPPTHENIRVFADENQLLAPKEDTDLCAFRVQPVKRWVDANGDDLESPDVPNSWTLTLESTVETLTCTWKKVELSCKGKAGEKDALDVPFDSSYTITESATPGFDQTGVGTFGPVGAPQNLTAFFNGDANIVVTVTNQLAEEQIEAATTTAAPTTTEAPTTTLAPTTTEGTTTTSTVADDESATSTTVASDESTSTTSTTIEPLLTGESVTTAPTTTESPTTTLAPTTTIAPTSTVASTSTLAPTSTVSASTTAPADETTSTSSANTSEPESSEVLPSDDRSPELTGDEVDPASVAPAQDTLPLTGGEAGVVAGLGFVLVVAGLGVLGFAWGSATPGRHARRRRMIF